MCAGAGARRRAGADLCRLRRRRDGLCAGARRGRRSRSSRTRSRSTRSSSISDRLPQLAPHHLRRAARPARLRPRPAESRSTTCRTIGREKLASDPECLRRWEAGSRGQGLRSRASSSTRRARPAAPKGVMLTLRQRHHLGAQRQSVRPARARTRKSSPICRSPGSAITSSPTRRPMSPASASIARKRRRPCVRGPARDRHDLRVRAAARLREPADAHHGAHGGCGALKRKMFHYFIGVARQLGREDPQQRAGAARRAPALRRSAMCWSTAR